MGRNKLKPKQKIFVQEYLKDLNASAAALRAGYRGQFAGAKLYQKKHIQDEIKRQKAQRGKDCKIESSRVLLELIRLGMSDCRRLFNADGTLKDPLQWDDETAPAVSSIEVVELFEGKGEEKRKTGEIKKLRFWDKNQALAKICDHLGMSGEGKEKSKAVRAFILPEEKIPLFKPDLPE